MENKNMMDQELENVTGGVTYGASYYIVKKGDTLSEIAVRHHITLNKLLALNPQIKNPDLIYPGDSIRVN
jgi:LysM repeat protein